jgi:hypothetical protein
MNARKTLIVAAVAVILLGAGVFLSLHRAGGQPDVNGGRIFADLEKSLAEVTEIRLSKGDGSRATLRKADSGWMLVERQYPADPARVRELALGLANLRAVERKTADPANYPKLGVEATDAPTATGTLVEVVAGKNTWSLIAGKPADGRALYVRKPAEAGSLLATPFIPVDPEHKRWLDRRIVDLAGTSVHDIAVRPGRGPAYLLRRPQPGVPDFTLTPVPKGRQAANPMTLGGQAEALVAFNFDDVRALPDAAPKATDMATYRTFDGQVFEFAGRREGDKAFVTVKARRDPALAAQFPPPAPPSPVAPAATDAAATAVPASPPPADTSVERLGPRAGGVEFEIPAYKYEAIFKPHEELLEKKT